MAKKAKSILSNITKWQSTLTGLAGLGTLVASFFVEPELGVKLKGISGALGGVGLLGAGNFTEPKK